MPLSDDICHGGIRLGKCATCRVRGFAVCAAMNGADLQALEAITTARRLAAGEILVQEGDPRRTVFTVTSGTLRLSIELRDGRRQITGFLMPGDFLGLADDETYSCTVEAVEATALCAIPVREMEALMRRSDPFRDRLSDFTRIALRQARESQLILGRLAPVEKLATFLILMSDRAAAHGQPADPLHLPMSRTDIADYLGLTIETVSRSFTKLRTQDLIVLHDTHRVAIPDRRALSAATGIARH